MNSKASNEARYSSLPTAEFDDDIEGIHVSRLVDKRLRQQNDSLSLLEGSISRLGQLSLNISMEIDDQNRMLTKLDDDTEAVQSKANLLMKKTTELVDQSGGPKLFCTIICLLCILLFLIFLVINT